MLKMKEKVYKNRNKLNTIKFIYFSKFFYDRKIT